MDNTQNQLLKDAARYRGFRARARMGFPNSDGCAIYKGVYLFIADFEDDVDNDAIDNIVDQFLAQK